MTNESRQAIAIVKARQKLKTGPQDLSIVTKNLGSAMKDIANTQRQFQARRVIEKFPVLSPAYNAVARFHKDIIPEWDTLFRNQLSHVSSLNESLIGVIFYSSEHLNKKQEQLLTEIDRTKSHLISYRESEQHLSDSKDTYESSKLFKSDFDPLNEDHYDLLKQQLTAEGDMVKDIGEISLKKEVHSKSLDKINFLERHISFYRGVLFSAKKLALATNQICEALDQLDDTYKGVHATRDCLMKVHSGVGILKGYTDDLRGLYVSTNDAINSLDENGETNILSSATRSLDSLVGQSYDRLLSDEPSNN